MADFDTKPAGGPTNTITANIFRVVHAAVGARAHLVYHRRLEVHEQHRLSNKAVGSEGQQNLNHDLAALLKAGGWMVSGATQPPGSYTHSS